MRECQRRFLAARSDALVAVALVLFGAGGCGGFGGNEPSLYQQEQDAVANAIDRLKAQGAKVEPKAYQVLGTYQTASSVDLSGVKQITEETFDALSKIGNISHLNFSGTPITDAQLARLNEPQFSQFCMLLDLSKTEISDEGLAALTVWPFLRDVVLTDTKVTADGIAKFRKKRQQAEKDLARPYKNVRVKQ